MLSRVFRQVRSAAGAEMRAKAEKVRGELLLPEALRAGGAFGDRVAEAVLEEERALLLGQVSRSSAVDVAYVNAVERDGVVERILLLSPRTIWLRRRVHGVDRTISH